MTVTELVSGWPWQALSVKVKEYRYIVFLLDFIQYSNYNLIQHRLHLIHSKRIIVIIILTLYGRKTEVIQLVGEISLAGVIIG